MKKFLFVALLGGSLIACNDTTTTMTHEDSVKYNDSVAAATSTPSTMGTDSMGTTPMTGSDSTSSNMMSHDSGSTMSDTSHK